MWKKRKKETLVFILELSTTDYIECLKKQKYNHGCHSVCSAKLSPTHRQSALSRVMLTILAIDDKLSYVKCT